MPDQPGAGGGAGTRTRIVEAADSLFYRQGYEHTSFQSIASVVGISRGNFYYHFQSKDQILAAVIDARLEERREMLARWDAEETSPAARIRRFIQIVVTNEDDIELYGCPVGTLTAELSKLGHIERDHAVALFTLFREWLIGHFRELGAGHRADVHALRVLAATQGIAAISNAFQDRSFVEREVQALTTWLDDIEGEVP